MDTATALLDLYTRQYFAVRVSSTMERSSNIGRDTATALDAVNADRARVGLGPLAWPDHIAPETSPEYGT